MRSILEKAIVHLLNEEHEQAQALFHKFMVERARQIHESLRNGEDAVLTEGWDENITSESYYTDDDLSGLEDKHDDAAPAGDLGADAGPVGDDMGADHGADMGGDDMGMDGGAEMHGGEDMGGDDMAADMDGAEMHGGEGDIADDLADIKDQLASLTAEFEKLMGGDDMGGDDMSGDDMGGDDMGGEFGGDDTTDSVDDDMTDDAGTETDMASDAEADSMEAPHDHKDEKKAPFGESKDESDDEETLEEEDFDDITESIVAELEKVSVAMTDGKEIAAGKSFSQNNTSVGLQKKPNPMTDGKPVQIKASEHKGFERETAPSVKDMKKRKNTKSKAEDGRSSVSKEGDKSALINKDFGKGGEANTKSPLAKR